MARGPQAVDRPVTPWTNDAGRSLIKAALPSSYAGGQPRWRHFVASVVSLGIFYRDRMGMKDFFISYAREDLEQAKRIEQYLEELGYTVIYDQDFVPGRSFVREIDNAPRESRCMIALYSRTSLGKKWPPAEWDTILVNDPSGVEDRFWPIRIEDCRISGLLARLIYTDLVGLKGSSRNNLSMSEFL